MNYSKWMFYHSLHSGRNYKYKRVRLCMDKYDIHIKRDLLFILQNLLSVFYKKYVLIYIHIPKTGGTYLTQSITDIPFISLNHSLIRDNFSDDWVPIGLTGTNYKFKNNHYIFTTVRHPQYFFRSYYHHVLGFGKYQNTMHYDYKNALKGFPYLIKNIMDREDRWPSRKFLFPQLFNQKGEKIVNWINRNESLDQDMGKLAKFLNFKYKAGKPKRKGPTKELYKYFDDKLTDSVFNCYKREFSLFGYEVNCKSLKKCKLNNLGMQYDYKNDNLSKI